MDECAVANVALVTVCGSALCVGGESESAWAVGVRVEGTKKVRSSPRTNTMKTTHPTTEDVVLPWLAHIIALVSAGVGIAAGVRCGSSTGTRCHCGSGSGSGSSSGGYDTCIESRFV